MRRERATVEHPVARRALHELLVPSIPLKLRAGVDTGFPDYAFLIPGGRPLIIEFKDPKGKTSAKQEYWHGILKDLGYDVQVHDNEETALIAIAGAVVAAFLSKEGRKVLARAWGWSSISRSGIGQNKHYTRSVQFLKEAGGC